MESSSQIFLTIMLFYITTSSTILLCQSATPFVAREFKIPEVFETDRFRLRMLTVNDVVKDYDAVMTSIDQLQGVFGPNSKWPSEDLTFEQDLIDLGWHQKEFQRRTSFAYTVMNLDESECLGCVYIVPTMKVGYEAEVYLWVRKSEYERGLDPLLYKSVKEWIGDQWPFVKVAFPGREIEWSEWDSLPE
jgi:RimJ/RimL family protein N-acetyltransferase